jgi:hypothetical protein
VRWCEDKRLVCAVPVAGKGRALGAFGVLGVLLLAWAGCSNGVEPEAAPPEASTARGVGVAAEGAGPDDEPPEPSGPPKRIFAKRFVVNVRTGPDPEKPRIGYLRGGSVLRATSAEPVGHEACRGGWYELTTGGFVCNGRDVIAFEGERLPEVRSAQPDRSARLPYEYGFIRRDGTPMYRRLPDEEQAARYEGGGTPEADRKAGEGPREGRDGGQSHSADTEPDGADPDGAEAPEVEPEGPPTLESLQASDEESDVLMRRLMRGFYVSLDRTFDVGRRRYWRTQQNGFVPFRQLMKVSGSDFRGLPLDGEEWSLPVAFVISGRTPRFAARDDGRLMRDREKPGYHHSFRIVGEREHRGRLYFEGGDGFFYRADDVVRVDPRDRPDDLTDTKWVDVDLGKQTLVAYDGERPVYVTLISSGRVRREDVPELNHATPTGTFRFSSKHLTGAMDGDSAIDGPYSIDDVPYVMYFHLAYATHTAFWHNRFGRPKSHGCINMAPRDAQWVFEWADPPLPEGWHGVYPTEDGPGTAIVIHGETPKG